MRLMPLPPDCSKSVFTTWPEDIAHSVSCSGASGDIVGIDIIPVSYRGRASSAPYSSIPRRFPLEPSGLFDDVMNQPPWEMLTGRLVCPHHIHQYISLPLPGARRPCPL